MKTRFRLFAWAWVLAFAFTLQADSLVSSYWPLNHGDIKNDIGPGGSSYTDLEKVSFGSSPHFLLHVYQQGPEDGEFYEEAAEEDGYSGDALLSYGGEMGWLEISYEPPLVLLDESLLANSGTRTTISVIEAPGTNIPVTVTVAVKSIGTIVVPAGVRQLPPA